MKRMLAAGVIGRHVAVAAALIVCGPAAVAQEVPPIVNGTNTSEFEAVGAMLACYGSSGCAQYCSATLVDREWIVTAAHCIEAADEYDRYGYDNYFGVGYRVDNLDDYDVLVEWDMHPDFHGSSGDLSHDVGVARLESGIGSVDPMPLNLDSVTNSWVGDELTYVGYGVTGDGRYDSGIKRFVEMPIYEVDQNIIYSLDLDDEQNICSGDSGGASLEPVGDGFELAGVNSFVFGWEYSDKDCEGGGSGVIRVDAHLDYFEDFFDVESSGGGGDDGDGGASGDGGSSDSGADGDAGADDGEDAPQRPFEGTDDDESLLGNCATASAPAALGLVFAGLAAVGLRRRREDDA